MYFFIKTILTAVLVVSISEAARRSVWLGGVLAAVPLTSVLAFIWTWHDTKNPETVAQLSTTIFWMVLPTLPLFLALPWLLRAGWGFYPALGAVVAGTVVLYAVWVVVVRQWGVTL